jgi:hypothetical protein
MAGMHGETPAARKVCAYLLEAEKQARIYEELQQVQRPQTAIELLYTTRDAVIEVDERLTKEIGSVRKDITSLGNKVISFESRLALKDRHDRDRDVLLERLERQQWDQVDQSWPAKETQQPPPPDWMTLWQYREKHKSLDIHSLSDNEVKTLHKCVKVYGSPHKFKLAASDRGPSNFYDPFWIQKGIKDFVRQKLMKVPNPKPYEKQLRFDDMKKQG